MVSWLLDNQMLIFRMLLACFLAGGAVVLLCPLWIRLVQRRRIVDQAKFSHHGLDGLMSSKIGTPTMGGCLLTAVILLTVLLLADLGNPLIRLILFALLWLGVLGAVDDFLKLRSPSRHGLYAWEKGLFQVALPALLAVFLYHQTSQQGSLPWFALKLTGLIFLTCNGANFTDGKDGLAGGCLLIVWVFFLLTSWAAGVAAWSSLFEQAFVPGAAELTILSAAVIGACAGFLWHNFRPASLFMGDSGSLPLGGMIGVLAVMLRQERFLWLLGGIFWVEIASVVLQIAWSRLTRKPGQPRGKYLFRCAPIHHHFMLGTQDSLRQRMRDGTLPRSLQGTVELFLAGTCDSLPSPTSVEQLNDDKVERLLEELTRQYEGKIVVRFWLVSLALLAGSLLLFIHGA